MLNPKETSNDRMKWEQSHHNKIKTVLKRLGFSDIQTAGFVDDTQNATDFLAEYKGERCHIASRLRRDDNGKYRDLTIRRDTDYGVNKSELDKIIEGRVDYYFYGWTKEGKMVDWMVVDMNAMRAINLLHIPDDVKYNVGNDEKSFAIWHMEGLWKSGVVMASNSKGKWSGRAEYKTPTLIDAQRAAESIHGTQKEKYEKLCEFFPTLKREYLYMYSFIKAG